MSTQELMTYSSSICDCAKKMVKVSKLRFKPSFLNHIVDVNGKLLNTNDQLMKEQKECDAAVAEIDLRSEALLREVRKLSIAGRRIWSGRDDARCKLYEVNGIAEENRVSL